MTSTSETGPSRSPATTLASLLRDDAVGWDELHARYGPLLQLVQRLLGVVPNCDRYLEIWPPAFRTYNLMVPNFLNLPFSVFGVRSAPADIVGLGMYVASRTAECPYCTAHACSFALRRGAPVETVAHALVPDVDSFSPGELATIAVARSLARIPTEITAAERDALIGAFGRAKSEWVVLGIVMMGFLNKFMNAIGVELEQDVVSEVATTLGPDWHPGDAGAELDPDAPSRPLPPVDDLRSKLALVPLVPKALRQDLQWQKGVPSTWPAVGAHLQRRVGHDFPVLDHLTHKRAIKTVASMLLANLDAATSIVGIDQKLYAGAVFADAVEDAALGADIRALATARGIDVSSLAGAIDPTVRVLTGAISPSPAEVTADVVAACRDGGLTSAAIVELVTWIAVLQMLHRLGCFYDAR